VWNNVLIKDGARRKVDVYRCCYSTHNNVYVYVYKSMGVEPVKGSSKNHVNY